MKVIVSFSGGKDSQACLIHAVEKYGASRVTAIFCDTGWEHPANYAHIKEVTERSEVELITLKPKFDFVSLAQLKKRFPSAIARFCTSELNIKPVIDYILSLKESCIVIQGIRASESASRAKLDTECMYFKAYFQPNEKGRKHTYRAKEVRQWCERYDASVLRPVFHWTAQQVIDFILDAGQKPNPLYYRGFSRVGCFPCVMSRHGDIRQLMTDEPMKRRLLEAEKKIQGSFFSSGYIPKHACSNGIYPMVPDVFGYVTAKNPELERPDGEDNACISQFHGLCE